MSNDDFIRLLMFIAFVVVAFFSYGIYTKGWLWFFVGCALSCVVPFGGFWLSSLFIEEIK